ncbi:MAG: hypothetical protein PUP92_18400, partial [Rhizonema sp. PD38]|nr:hypothetical protein [Rhizonema sp. PD38]
HQNTLMEAIIVHPRETTTQKTESITELAHLITPICLITVCTIIFYIFRQSFLKIPGNSKVVIYRFRQAPCINCHFFNKNQYLRCAVHPLIVSTKQALNCSDYCHKSSKNETETIDDND